MMDMSRDLTTARALAAEDIRPGDYVSVLHVVTEHFPWWCDDEAWRTVEMRRLLWMPWEEPAPMKVVEVCLPFVIVRRVDGTHRMIDTRRYRLARVSTRFGKQAFIRLRPRKAEDITD